MMPDTFLDYRETLFKCLNYLDGTDLDVHNDSIPSDRLWDLTPADLMRFFHFQTFGVENPLYHATPLLISSDKLNKMRQEISFFMPYNHFPWDGKEQWGNPTLSDEFWQLYNYLRKKEATRKPLDEMHLRYVMASAHRQRDNLTKYGIRALCCVQFSMLGRLDDCLQWETSNLRLHDSFPDFALQARLSSFKKKNGQEEEYDDDDGAPWHILLGSMNPTFCAFIHLAIWLEWSLSYRQRGPLSPHVFSFSRDTGKSSGARKSKAIALRILSNLYDCEESAFEDIDNDDDDDNDNETGPWGSHSLRKFACNWLSRHGGSINEKEIRGQWKKGQESDMDDDDDDDYREYMDATAADRLCVGGPCSYQINAHSGVTHCWIAGNVTPNIADVYGEALAEALGKALLWCIFSQYQEWVPPSLCNHVIGAYQALPKTIPMGENPISKIPISSANEVQSDQHRFDSRERKILQTMAAQVRAMRHQRANQPWEPDDFSRMISNIVQTANASLCDLHQERAMAIEEKNRITALDENNLGVNSQRQNINQGDHTYW